MNEEDRKELLCPKAGTATSSPTDTTPSPTDRGYGKMTQQTIQKTN